MPSADTIADMGTKQYDKFRNGIQKFGQIMFDKGIDDLHIEGDKAVFTPPPSSEILNGFLFCAMQASGIERVQVMKYGSPVVAAEAWATMVSGDEVIYPLRV